MSRRQVMQQIIQTQNRLYRLRNEVQADKLYLQRVIAKYHGLLSLLLPVSLLIGWRVIPLQRFSGVVAKLVETGVLLSRIGMV